MKKKKCCCDYIEARNENLKKEFFSRLGKDGYKRIDDIFRELASVRASRFYINEDRAYKLVRKYLATGELPPRMIPMKRLMLLTMARRVETLRAFRPQLTLRDAVYEVVNSQAPSYYLTPRSIRTLLYDYLHQRG